MSDPDLFPEARSLSPKLKWLFKHELRTKQSKSKHTLPWLCYSMNDERTGEGLTEEEACIDFSIQFRIKHWTIESP